MKIEVTSYVSQQPSSKPQVNPPEVHMKKLLLPITTLFFAVTLWADTLKDGHYMGVDNSHTNPTCGQSVREEYNVTTQLDFSGITAFQTIFNSLQEDKEPSEEQWRELEQSPGYKILLKRDFSKIGFRKPFRLAFMPSKSKELSEKLKSNKGQLGFSWGGFNLNYGSLYKLGDPIF